jgi:hypothetical protein
VLEQFFAEQADPTRSALVQKVKGVLDGYVQGSISHSDFLQMVHQECILVQSAFEEVPEGPESSIYEEALSLYLEALFTLGREVEAEGALSEDVQKVVFDLAARADEKMDAYDAEVSENIENQA